MPVVVEENQTQFTWQGVNDGGVTFTDTSYAQNPVNSTHTCHWDFGDGTTSEEDNPTHYYESSFCYAVTLTTTWSGGEPTVDFSVQDVTVVLAADTAQLWHFDAVLYDNTTEEVVAEYVQQLSGGLSIGGPNAGPGQFGEGSALSMDGGSNEFFPSTDTSSTGWTIEFSTWWGNNEHSSGGYLFMLNRGGSNELLINFVPSGDASFYYVNFGTSGNDTQYHSGQTPTNDWVRWAVVFWPDAEEFYIYMNGVLVYTGAELNPDFDWSSGWSWSNEVGRSGYNYNYGDPIFVDELRFSKVPLYVDRETYGLTPGPFHYSTTQGGGGGGGAGGSSGNGGPLPLQDFIDQSATHTEGQRIRKAQFNDGFSEEAPDGINTHLSHWSISWSNLTAAERAVVVNHLRAIGQTKYTTWTPFGDTVEKRFKVADGWTERFTGSSLFTISCSLRETR